MADNCISDIHFVVLQDSNTYPSHLLLIKLNFRASDILLFNCSFELFAF